MFKPNLTKRYHLFWLVCSLFVFNEAIKAQGCTGCTTVISTNSSANITISAGSTVCIAPGVSVTGTITLNGGKLCNEGTVSNLTLIQGIFDNYGTFNKPTGNLTISNAKNLKINCYPNSVFNVVGAVNIACVADADSVVINVYAGSSMFSIGGNLAITKGWLKIKNSVIDPFSIAVLASTFNVGGQFNVNNARLSLTNGGTFNVNGAINLDGKFSKEINNYDFFNSNNSLNITGNGQNSATVTINSYAFFNITGNISSAYNNGVVNINNNITNPFGSSGFINSFNIGGGLTFSKDNNNFNNLLGPVNVNLDVFIERGSVTNTGTLTARDYDVKFGTITNNSSLIANRDFITSNGAAIVNNNNELRILGELRSKGTINLGKRSLTLANNLIHLNGGNIYGPSNLLDNSGLVDSTNYAYIYVRNTSDNNGNLNNYLALIDLSYTGTSNYKIDNINNKPQNIGSNVTFHIGITVLNKFFYIVNTCTDVGQTETIFIKDGESIDLTAQHFNGFAYLNCLSAGAPSQCACPGRLINTTGSPNVTWEWKAKGSSSVISSTNRLITTPTESGEYYVTFNINGFRSAGPPIRVVILKNNYDVPKKKLDAGHYQLSDGRYYFKFIEEYNVSLSAPLQYKIYHDSYSPLSSVPGQVEKMGDNRYAVNLTTSGLTTGAYYIVEIFNSKNERWVSRIKYKP